MTSARRRRTRPTRSAGRVRSTAGQHAFALLSTLGRLRRDPTGTFLTVAVIAIAIALPAGLYVLLKNVQAVSDGWQSTGEITVFLEPGADERTAADLAAELATRPDVASTSVIDPTQALAALEAQGDFGDALDALDFNPLPWTVAATPRSDLTADAMAELVAAAETLPQVRFAQFDMAWLIRFNSMLEAARRFVQLIAALLTLGVLLIVGNTIRLDIENRREEIEIIKMLGGTNAFVRRPFLYTGTWLGAAGGIAALVVLVAALAVLAGPVRELAAAYQSDASLTGPGLRESGALLAGSAIMGWIGAWIAVARHLAAVQPDAR